MILILETKNRQIKLDVMKKTEEFNAYREKMNERILSDDNLFVKRFFNMDTNAYKEGALPVKTKEMLGLVASLVLRCDDCVKYHLEKVQENNATKEEVWECFEISMLVGGSIVIPHFRRAVEYWDELTAK